ncbi:MAG: hypothetical protein ACOYMQ_13690 [Pseudanabaena sp.]
MTQPNNKPPLPSMLKLLFSIGKSAIARCKNLAIALTIGLKRLLYKYPKHYQRLAISSQTTRAIAKLIRIFA